MVITIFFKNEFPFASADMDLGINCLHGAIVEGTEDGCADTSWTPAFGTGDKGEGEGQPFCCLPGQHGLRSDEGNYCVDISSTSVCVQYLHSAGQCQEA